MKTPRALSVLLAASLLFVAALVVVNYIGITESVVINMVMTFVEVAGLLIVLLIGIWYVAEGSADFGVLTSIDTSGDYGSPALAVLATLATYSNLDKGNAYAQKTLDLTAFKGQAVTITFAGAENDGAATSFIIDDVSVNVQ